MTISPSELLILIATIFTTILILFLFIYYTIAQDRNFVGIDNETKIYSNKWNPKLLLFYKCFGIKRYSRNKVYQKWTYLKAISSDNISFRADIQYRYKYNIHHLSLLSELKNIDPNEFAKETVEKHIRDQFENITPNDLPNCINMLTDQIDFDYISSLSYIDIDINSCYISFGKNNNVRLEKIEIKNNQISLIYDFKKHINQNKIKLVDLEV